MPTIAQAAQGIVTALWGHALIRGADGKMRALKLGDRIQRGDTILTTQDGIVQISPDGDGAPVRVAAKPAAPAESELDRVIGELNRGDERSAPAAGLAGGGDGSLEEGLRVERIAEGTGSTGTSSGSSAVERIVFSEPGGAPNQPQTTTTPTPGLGASSSSLTVAEEGAPANLGLEAPTGTQPGASVTVTAVPAIGTLHTADGTLVTAGTVLTPDQLAGLVYTPPADYTSGTPVGGFGYVVQSGGSSASGGTTITVTPVNDTPVASAGSASGAEDAVLPIALSGSDVDGTIAGVTVTGLPVGGTLMLADGQTVVTVGQTLSADQAATLLFRPDANFHGDAGGITFTVTDDAGAVSAPARFTLLVAPVNDAPLAADDTARAIGTAPVRIDVLANDSDPDGDRLSVTHASVDPALGSVTIGADGSLNFSAARGVSGAVNVSYTVTDPSGASASATVVVTVAPGPTVTVDAPPLTSDATPTLTGTTTLPAGSVVTLVVTDSAGASQTVIATVAAGGTYSADVPAALAEGRYTVVASATDTAGNMATADDAGAIDLTPPALTVDAPALTNDATPTIAGTTNLPAGSVVTLVVTDSAGVSQTISATVTAGGTYAVDVPATLAEGGYTVVASATDTAGNQATANDTGAIDLSAPALTVDAPALTNDATPTITGTSNLPAGSTVSLIVTDATGASQNVTATVVAGGTYSVEVPAALAEGKYTVVASASDAAGNGATANDSGAVDLSAPTLTVDAPALTNDSTPTLSGTTDLPAGSTITLVVTDSAGASQTVTAAVAAGGTYAVDVPAALAEGSYTVVASATDAAGNGATANDSGAIDLTAPTLTVDAPALTNDSTPTINGTTNLPAGSTVTLVVTDAAGESQTVVATVIAGGTYTVDVPAALAEGSYTVVASASDAAGNSASANDAGAIDLTAPALTVDAPALTNDSTPTITGTTNLPAGSSVTLVVTDSAGVSQTVSATVMAGGTYSVDVPAALAEGTYAVVASATDAAGNVASANDVGAIDLTAPTLTVDAPALTNDSTPAITGTTNLPAGSTVNLVVTDSAGASQTVTATVAAGGTYSVDVPAAMAEGNYTVVASATDAAGNSALANDVGAIDLTAPTLTVDAPALTNDSTPTISGTTDLPAGSAVTLVVTDSAGASQTVTATVAPGGTYSVDVPAALAEGSYTVVASATDAAGNGATASDAGAIDLTAPTLTVDAPALTNDSTPAITGTTNLPAGSTVNLVVTDSAGASQTVVATVAAGGTYSVDVPAAMAEGNYTVVASATDAAGNVASANDAGAIDLTAPTLTVDAPALTNDSTPTISGTTDLPAGSAVTLVVTDSAGVSQTVAATVMAGGTYSVDVPAAMAEGNYTVVASATDAAGNSALANDAGAVDLTAPTLTVDAPALTNDSTPTISGTTDLPAGSTVTLVVTDSAGVSQTVSATVMAGGTYSIDVPAALAEGSYAVVASATDAAGNTASANDVGAIDLSAPTLTVDAPGLTNDSTPTITGTTDLPAGSAVTLVVTDSAGASQTVIATVAAGGTYAVDVPAALAEGNYTVVASAADAAGNGATANDSGAIDLTAPSLTVDAPGLTNDSTPTITGTTSLPAGSTITLVVTDSAGASQSMTATVAAGGNYAVDVPAALAEGHYGVVASATDAAGNSASANDVGAIDLTAPTLTVDAPLLTNDPTPTISGTTDLPAGSAVNLVITDSAGASQTVVATVAAGGTYSIDVPAALAEGHYTVVASAADAAGNAATANDAGAIDLTAPTLTVDAPALTNDSTPTISGTTDLPAGSAVTLVITDSAGASQTISATVMAGGTYSVELPAALAEGSYTVVASATDAAGNTASANDVGAIDLSAPTLTVDAPGLTNDSTPTITGTTDLPAGSAVSLVVTDSAGASQTVIATVAAGGTYAVDVPAALAEGNYTVVASAADAAGNGATANDSGAIDLTAPTLTVDAPALTNDSTPTVSGTTDLPAGSAVTLLITDSAGASQTVTATVAPGGTYSVDVPAALAEGTFTVVASATDAAGNVASANDAGAIDLTAPTLTVDTPTLTNDSTPTISGTTNLPAGSTVSLVVTDSAGTSQTVTATVAAGGTYSVDVPTALAGGAYTVVASAADAAGNSASANGAGAVDLTAPTLTVDAPALTNDSTPMITGTTDLPAGSAVTLLITDSAGASQTVSATVMAGGTYSVDVPAALAEGSYTVVASATDAAGNSASANDAGAIDLTAPTLTVDAPALTNDSTPTITGTTDLPAGSAVTLVITDSAGASQTVSATVMAGGTYSVEVPAALAEGHYTVVASATDAAGNVASANDAGAIDLTAPTLTVDAPALTNDSTPTITGSTDLPAGAAVTLLVTDSAGASQTVIATVAAGGTYAVDVPAALAEGHYAVVASATDAAGNSATANDAGAIDLTAPTLTVDAPALTNDATPTITGASNLPVGSTVSLLVTDAAGTSQTVSATVAAGGTYSVDVPAALAEGQYTVVASASDAAGNAASASDSGMLDLTPPAATLTLAPVTADNVLSAAEAGGNVLVGGTAGGDAQAGDIVTLVIAGQSFQASVGAGGAFSVSVAGSLLAADADHRIDATLTITDAAGNSSTATAFQAYGVNSAPTGSDQTVATLEDTPHVFSAADFPYTDTDGQPIAAVRIDSLPGAGTLTLNGVPVAAGQVIAAADLGQLSFAPAANASGSGYASFTFSVGDGIDFDPAPNRLTIDVSPVNDPAVVGGPTSATAVEDAPGSVGGALTISDPDAGEAGFVPQSAVAGAHGSFSVDAAGQWSYTLDNADPAVQALGLGTALPDETFWVRSIDGVWTQITVQIRGSNDAPVALADTRTTPEDTPVSGNVLGNDSDVDAGSTLAVTQFSIGGTTFAAGATATLAGVGTLTIGADGAYTFTPAANYAGAVPVASYTVSDGLASTSASLTLTLTPQNDAPLAQPDSAIAVEAGGVANASAGTNPSGNVLANDTDVDAGDSQTVTAVTGASAGSIGGSTAGSYGTLTLNADGSYSYVVDNSLAAVQALRGAGNTLTDTFTYTLRDAAGATSTATLTVTVQGANDAPVASADSASLAENASISTTAATGVLANDSDVDAGDTRVVSGIAFGATAGTVGSALNGTYGTLTLNADGSYGYSANRPAADALTAGQVVTETFTVTVRDSAGATSSSTLSFTLTGANDAPAITGTSTGSVREDVTLTTGGTLTVVDPDAGQSVFNAQSGNGTYGSFSIDAAGVWSYSLNNTAANVQALTGSSVVTETFSVTTADGTSRNVVVTVNGTNEAPTAVADVRTTNEDSAVSGNVLSNDSDVDSASLAVTQFVVGGSTYAAGATASLAGVGTLTIASSGAYTFTPAANYAGAVPVATYTVSDGSATSSSTLALSITAVADAPTLVINGTTVTGGSVSPSTLPPSTGLTLQFYDNIGALSPSNAGSIAAVEAGVEGSTATSTSTASDVAVGNIGVDDAYRYTGYIYLQAGQSYTVAGYRDDTLMVKIGGDSVYSVGFNNWGNVTGSTFTPTASGYYSLEVIAYNGDGVGSLDLGLSVNGAAAVDLNSTNFHLYSSTSGFAGTALGALVPNADGGYYPTTVTGAEDSAIALGSIAASLNDTDGSETLAVNVSGLQPGGMLTDGVHVFNATAGSTAVSLAGWNLANLQYRPPADFNGSTTLTVSATATEANGSSATTTATLPINVTAVNDAPVGVADSASVAEGSVTLIGSVLANDSDVETSATGVAVVATSSSGTAVAANGVDAITTALGGTVVMNADGSYRYYAPAVSHGADPVVDSFVYRPTDGTTAGAWTTVSITLGDSNPTAAADSGTVAWGSTVSGNLLTNDAAIDAAKTLVSVAGTSVAAVGTTTIALGNGTLQVTADGSFTYTSSQAASGTAGGITEAAWRASTGGLWGFTDNAWSSSGNLKLSALATQPDLVNYQGGSKPGLEIGSSGVQFGEALIIHLPESSIQASVTLNQLNASQPTANWFAYDANGVLVGSGTFAAGPSNGTSSVQTITTSQPFEYLRFGNTVSGGQGYVVNALDYTKLASNHVDSISYTMRDGDGDTSTAQLTLTPGGTSSFTTSLPAGTSGDDVLTGSSGADSMSGSDGNDQLRGLGGADSLDGGNGHDLLSGHAGNDSLAGGAGNDILVGGVGHDTLTGGAGADVFAWSLADAGTAGTPATDTITDFSAAAVSAGGDVLDLRDLLGGEAAGAGHTAGNLTNYLEFSVSGSGANASTTIHISSTGQFANGTYTPGQEDQAIVLQGVDLPSALGLAANATDAQIIQELLTRGKLIVDGAA